MHQWNTDIIIVPCSNGGAINLVVMNNCNFIDIYMLSNLTNQHMHCTWSTIDNGI